MSAEKSPSEQLAAWEAFVASEPWAWLQQAIAEQMHLRQQNVMLTPLAEADGVFQQEFMKGEFQALAMVVKLPELAIENLKTDIATLNQENGNAQL